MQQSTALFQLKFVNKSRERCQSETKVVDRVYKTDLPRLKRKLEELKEGFSKIGPSRTDWVGLRIDPLLRHADSLERLSRSEEFSEEFSHLRRGVALFRSDLVYLRGNVEALQKLLESERRSAK